MRIFATEGAERARVISYETATGMVRDVSTEGGIGYAARRALGRAI